MRLLILTLSGLLIVACKVQAQSPAVRFETMIPGLVNAPVQRPSGEGAGAGFVAELVVLSGGSATVLTPVTTFKVSSALDALYVNPVDVPIPGGSPGQQVTLAFRVYPSEAGSYNGAIAARFLHGQSAPITVTLRALDQAAIELVGLQGFTLLVPEPSVVAAAILGMGVLAIRLRNRSIHSNA